MSGIGSFISSLFGGGSDYSATYNTGGGGSVKDLIGAATSSVLDPEKKKGFDFGNLLESALPTALTVGASLLSEGMKPDPESPEELRAANEVIRDKDSERQIALKLKLKELGLDGGGGGGGGRTYRPVDASALASAQNTAVQQKLAQAQLSKEMFDQLAGRLNQAILSRRR